MCKDAPGEGILFSDVRPLLSHGVDSCLKEKRTGLDRVLSWSSAHCHDGFLVLRLGNCNSC
jgi:hypothetical protein